MIATGSPNDEADKSLRLRQGLQGEAIRCRYGTSRRRRPWRHSHGQATAQNSLPNLVGAAKHRRSYPITRRELQAIGSPVNGPIEKGASVLKDYGGEVRRWTAGDGFDESNNVLARNRCYGADLPNGRSTPSEFPFPYPWLCAGPLRDALGSPRRPLRR
jgi:hypothetical protein